MGSAQSTSSKNAEQKKAADIKKIPDQILNTIFNTSRMKDIIDVSSTDKCSRYIFLTKDALDKLFYQLNVEPKEGVPIYFAPVAELTAMPKNSKDRPLQEKVDARNRNCMRIAFFYIRLFQITAALSLNMGDISPIQTPSITGASSAFVSYDSSSKGPMRLVGGNPPGALSQEDDLLDILIKYFPSTFSTGTYQSGLFIKTNEPQTGEPIFLLNKAFELMPAKEEEYMYITNIDLGGDSINPIPSSVGNRFTIPIEYVYIYKRKGINGGDEMNFRYDSSSPSEPSSTTLNFVIERVSDTLLNGYLELDGTRIEPVYSGTKIDTPLFTQKRRTKRADKMINWTESRMNKQRQAQLIMLAMRQKHGNGQIVIPQIGTTTNTANTSFAPIQLIKPTVSVPSSAPTTFTSSTVPGAGATTTTSTTAIKPYTAYTTQPTYTSAVSSAPFVSASASASAPSSSTVPQIQAVGRITTSEFYALNELRKRLLEEKAYPKAYAVGRAMVLLNPVHPSEATNTTIFSSDICRPKSRPVAFDTRLQAMPYPQSQSTANIYFKSLISLYYDKFDIINGKLELEQTPPGRDSLIKASQDLGTLFFVGNQQEQFNFLYQPKVIKAPPICPSQYYGIQFNNDPKFNAPRKALIGKLRAVASKLFELQNNYNKSAIQILKLLFDTSSKDFKLRQDVYKGGIPYVNKVAEKARTLLLEYYRKSEANYVIGVELITLAHRQTPELIVFTT